MEKYDYKSVICEDIRNYIKENDIELFEGEEDNLRESLYDNLWADDSVTGNGSGSYFCNAWRAEEAICHNLDLLQEALYEFGSEFTGSAEEADVTIRCYLLGECIDSVLSEMEAKQVEEI